jgi:hypothetical protein
MGNEREKIICITGESTKNNIEFIISNPNAKKCLDAS